MNIWVFFCGEKWRNENDDEARNNDVYKCFVDALQRWLSDGISMVFLRYFGWKIFTRVTINIAFCQLYTSKLLRIASAICVCFFFKFRFEHRKHRHKQKKTRFCFFYIINWYMPLRRTFARLLCQNERIYNAVCFGRIGEAYMPYKLWQSIYVMSISEHV